MPKLPTADSALGERPTPRPQRQIVAPNMGATDQAAYEAGGAMVQAGAELSRTAERLQLGADRTALAEANTAFLKARMAAETELDADPDYKTWAPRFRERLEATQKEIAGRLNGRVASVFNADATRALETGAAQFTAKTRLRERDDDIAGLETRIGDRLTDASKAADANVRGGLLEAIKDDIAGLVAKGSLSKQRGNQLGRAAANDFTKMLHVEQAGALTADLDRERNALLNDPASFSSRLEAFRAKVDASPLPETEKAKLRTQAQTGMALSAVQSEIGSNPAAALAKLERGTWDGFLDADRKAAALTAARAGVERQAAEAERKRNEATSAARADVSLRFSDEIATIRATGQPANLVTPDLIRAAYPNQPDRAVALINQIEAEKRFYTVRQGVALTSPAEDAATLGRLTAAQSGEGAEQATQQANDYRRAVAAKREALATDPGAYVLSASPDLRAAFEAANTDPAALPRALAMSEDMQARLGVAPLDRRLLGKDQAERIVQTIMATPAERLDEALAAQARQFGPYWPQAFRELKAAKLPAHMEVLLTMPDPAARTRMGEAFRAEAAKKGALRDLAGLEAKPANDAVAEGMREFRQSFALAPGGAALAAQYQEAATLLAYRYMSEGKGASEAADLAVRDFTGRYDFNRTARAPKGRLGLMEGFGTATIAALDPAALDVPPPGPGEPQRDDVQRRTLYADAIKRGGFWTTNETDDGWILRDPAGQPVTRTDGSRIEFRFDAVPESRELWPNRGRGVAADEMQRRGMAPVIPGQRRYDFGLEPAK